MKRNINRIISMLMVFLILFSNGNIFASGTEASPTKALKIEPLKSYDSPKKTYDGMTFLGEIGGDNLITYDELINNFGNEITIANGEISNAWLNDNFGFVPNSEGDKKQKYEKSKGGIWLKFIDHKYTRDGKPRIFYVAKKPILIGATWDKLHTIGTVYGWDVIDPETEQPKINPEKYKYIDDHGSDKDYHAKIIKINGKKYIIRLLQGKTNYGGDVTNTKLYSYNKNNVNSEWNRTILPITKYHRFGEYTDGSEYKSSSNEEYEKHKNDYAEDALLEKEKNSNNYKVQTADYDWFGDLTLGAGNPPIQGMPVMTMGQYSWVQEHSDSYPYDNNYRDKYSKCNRGSLSIFQGAAASKTYKKASDYEFGSRLVLEPYESDYDGMYLLREVKGNDFISYKESLKKLGINKDVLDYPPNVSNAYSKLKQKHTEELNNGGMWLEFMDTKYKNDKGEPRIFYVSKKPLTKGISWDELFDAGCVYGPDLLSSDGLIKTNPNKYKNKNKLYKSKIIKIGNKYFVPRLLRGTSNYGADPLASAKSDETYNSTGAPNSEWNRTIVAATKQYRGTSNAMETLLKEGNTDTNYGYVNKDYVNNIGEYNWFGDFVLGSSSSFTYNGKEINENLPNYGQSSWCQETNIESNKLYRGGASEKSGAKEGFGAAYSNNDDSSHNLDQFSLRLVWEEIDFSYGFINFDKNFKNATGETPQKKLFKGASFTMETPNYKSPKAFIIGYYKTDSETLSKTEKDMISNLTIEDLDKPKEELLKKGIYKAKQDYTFKEIFNKPDFNTGDNVTMHAIWYEINNDLRFKNGEVEFMLRHGDSVAFNGLPAYTSYEIYEQSEAGWNLIKSINDKGKIIPNGKIESVFTNSYEPKVAYAQFNGTKTVDNERTDVKDYEFEIYQNGTVETDGTIKGGKLLETVKSDQNGYFRFGEFQYDADQKISKALFKYTKGNKDNGNNDLGTATKKEFTYYIKEKTQSTELIKKDPSIYKVIVTITDDGKGNLKADYNTTKVFDGENILTQNNKTDLISFNNTRAKENLKIVKIIETDKNNNIDINELNSEFKVKVKLSSEPEERVITLKKQDNKYEAVINDLLPGTKYEIIESDIPDGYKIISYEDVGNKKIEIKNNQNEAILGAIKITKNVDGKPKKTSLIGGKEVKNEVIITNKYESEGIFSFSLNKELKGRDLKKDEFEFGLYDETEKELITTVKNSTSYDGTNAENLQNGFSSVNFNGIKLTKAGVNTFVVKEINTNNPTIKYDDSKFKIQINAVDDGTGKLIPTKNETTQKDDVKVFKYIDNLWKEIKIEDAKFINELKPGTLTIKKIVDNSINDNKFTVKLSLTDKNGKPLTQKFKMSSNVIDRKEETIGNDDQIIISNSETLTIEGLPENTIYKIIETNLPDGYKLVKTDNTSGVIKSNEISDAVLTNSYVKGTYTIEGKKVLKVPDHVDRKLLAGEFTFLLLNENNEILSKTTNDKDGIFKFDPINFTDEDYERYKNQDIVYKIMEDRGDKSNTIYDMSEFEVRLKLYKENGLIKIKEEIRKNKLSADKILFVNNHTENLKLSIKKNVNGESSQDSIFQVKVSIKKPGEEAFTDKMINIVNKQTIDFENLPEGTEVKIVETKFGEEYNFQGFKVDGKTETSITDNTLHITLKSKPETQANPKLTLVEIDNKKNPTGSYNFTFYKRLNGNDYPKYNTFRFKVSGPCLTNENNEIVNFIEANNDDFGNIKIKFDFKTEDANTHRKYLIEEINDHQPLIGYDTTKYQLDFDVKIDQDNNLYADKVVITEKDGDQNKKFDDVVFNNTKKFFSFPVTGTSKTMLAFLIGIAGILLYIFISQKRFKKLK